MLAESPFRVNSRPVSFWMWLLVKVLRVIYHHRIIQRRRDHFRMVDARYREWQKLPSALSRIQTPQLPPLQQHRATFNVDTVLHPGEIWAYHEPYGRLGFSLTPLPGPGWVVKDSEIDSCIEYRIWCKKVDAKVAASQIKWPSEEDVVSIDQRLNISPPGPGHWIGGQVPDDELLNEIDYRYRAMGERA